VSMTFVQIVNAVLADGFAEAKRVDAKLWVQARHAWLWDLEDWTFKQGDGNVTFTANSQVVALGAITDLHAVLGLYNAQGAPLRGYKDPREFFDRYNANISVGSGSAPEAYTMWGSQLLVGPKGDGSTGLLLYEKSKPSLVNDADTTGLPEGYDVALVHGGKAEGFKLANVPLWQGFDDDFTAFANALEKNYLVSVKEQGSQQLRAYRP